MCLGGISPELKQACEQKNISIVNGIIGASDRQYTIDSITKQLLRNNTIFVTYAEHYITKKMIFCLMNEVNSNITLDNYHLNGFFVIDDMYDKEYKSKSTEIKRIMADFRVTAITGIKFINSSFDQLIPNQQKDQDMKRVEAIAPYYYFYNLQDLLPLLCAELERIRNIEQKESRIGKWPIIFDASFNILNDNNKYKLLRKIETKYHDFDDIIYRTSEQMKNFYRKGSSSKLCNTGIPHKLELVQMFFKDNNLRFRINVFEHGKKDTYNFGAGGFFVPWT